MPCLRLNYSSHTRASSWDPVLSKTFLLTKNLLHWPHRDLCMKFKILQRTSRPLQRDKPTHPRARPFSFIQPLHLLPPAMNVMRDAINHSLRAARWASGGGEWKRARGKGLHLEIPTGSSSPPPDGRTGQVPTEDSEGHLGFEMQQKDNIEGGGNVLDWPKSLFGFFPFNCSSSV